jgi:DNA-binding transcriptional MerR regulator
MSRGCETGQELPTQPKYRIQAVADMTGIPTGTLRAWERRYGLPQPRRSDNRYRLYTDDDIAAVRAMSRMCADGLAPSEAARVVRARLDRGELLEETPPPSPAWTPQESSEDEWALVAKSIVDAASSFDATRLDAAVRRALVMGPAFEIFDRAFAPALRTLG